MILLFQPLSSPPDSTVVAVNKMESVGFDNSRFKTITTSIEAALRKAQVPKDSARFIPISALHEHNVDSPSNKMPWYTGSTLFEALRSISEEQSALRVQPNGPLRVTLRDIYLVGGIGACACGKVWELGSPFDPPDPPEPVMSTVSRSSLAPSRLARRLSSHPRG